MQLTASGKGIGGALLCLSRETAVIPTAVIPPTPALTNGQSVPFLPQLEVQFLPSTVKSLVPEPILSINQFFHLAQ